MAALKTIFRKQVFNDKPYGRLKSNV